MCSGTYIQLHMAWTERVYDLCKYEMNAICIWLLYGPLCEVVLAPSKQVYYDVQNHVFLDFHFYSIWLNSLLFLNLLFIEMECGWLDISEEFNLWQFLLLCCIWLDCRVLMKAIVIREFLVSYESYSRRWTIMFGAITQMHNNMDKFSFEIIRFGASYDPCPNYTYHSNKPLYYIRY